MKCNLTDHGTGVLLILRGPRSTPALRGGTVVDAMVNHLDVFPTICDVAGIPHPEWLQGRSLLPLAGGEVETLHEELFAEVNYHAAYEPVRAVRTSRWKYIRRYHDYGRPVLPNCDNGLSKDVWLRYGWPEQDTAPEQLYDLIFDPQERHNLAGDPRNAAELDALRGRLDRWMRATDDPLLRGPLPLPEGAIATPQTALSPR
jgi:arylsulfatase A-like enzyme